MVQEPERLSDFGGYLVAGKTLPTASLLHLCRSSIMSVRFMLHPRFIYCPACFCLIIQLPEGTDGYCLFQDESVTPNHPCIRPTATYTAFTSMVSVQAASVSKPAAIGIKYDHFIDQGFAFQRSAR
ncbi:hypothetical protein ACMYSQ_005818 [Aspergillus niger]